MWQAERKQYKILTSIHSNSLLICLSYRIKPKISQTTIARATKFEVNYCTYVDQVNVRYWPRPHQPPLIDKKWIASLTWMLNSPFVVNTIRMNRLIISQNLNEIAKFRLKLFIKIWHIYWFWGPFLYATQYKYYIII